MKLKELLFGNSNQEKAQPDLVPGQPDNVVNLSEYRDQKEKEAHGQLVEKVAENTGRAPREATPPTSQAIKVKQGKGGIPEFDYEIPSSKQGDAQVTQQPKPQNVQSLRKIIAPIQKVGGFVNKELVYTHATLANDERRDLGVHEGPSDPLLNLNKTRAERKPKAA